MKNYFSLLLSCFFIAGGAQTLTQNFNEPVIGDIDKNYRLDTSAFVSGLPLNVTGNNCNWNYTGLTGIFPMVVDSFIAPAVAPGATAYPSASYVQHRDILYSYYKSSTSPQQTELLGAYSPSLTLTFTNSAIIAGYPVNYGYNLTDPVSGGFKYNSTNGGCNGNITIAADGIGTLNLPNGINIPNVLRLKSVEILTLNVGIIPFGSFNQTIYNYYEPGKKFPVLNISYTTYQLLAGTPTITAIIYGSNNYFSVANINELKNQEKFYTLYPNPFKDELFIKSNALPGEEEFLLYDFSGKLLITTKLPEESTKSLAPGIYFVEIRSSSGSYRQKIIKE